MPLYDYQCKCGKRFESFFYMKDDSSTAVCECGKTANKKFMPPALKTDTSFFATGAYDDRLCDSRRDVIQGRRDWHKRLEDRNLVEIDRSVLDAPPPVPEPSF